MWSTKKIEYIFSNLINTDLHFNNYEELKTMDNSHIFSMYVCMHANIKFLLDPTTIFSNSTL